MPGPTPFPSPFPALYLYPLNDSFIPKHISLLHNQHVKIGRQTNAKTTPGERNGYFDSKVLSRQHAEVWEEGGKIFIKDVKSSNGTFINGERLSPESLESDPFELKSDDIVEFGIDIVGEDNKTIVHHKVAARVVCIFSEADVQMAARAEQHSIQHMQQFGPGAGGGPGPGPAGPGGGPSPTLSSPTGPVNGSSSFNFSNQQPPRRPQISQQGISGMGGMGASMRPPGKSGLTFDHILSRLQGELQKSRETGAELHTLTNAMNDIHDTLGGSNLPPASFSHNLPPVRAPPTSPPPPPAPAPPADPPSESSNTPSTLLTDLQSQLKDTQASLSQHVDKIRVLEEALKEQDAIRHEVRLLRDMMDAVQRQSSSSSTTTIDIPPAPTPKGGFDVDEDEEPIDDEFDNDISDDDDDARSVATAVPHELERVEEEDEEIITESNQERGSSDADVEGGDHPQEVLGRPRTPEPSNLGMSRSKGPLSPSHPSSPSSSLSSNTTLLNDLTTQLTSLSAQLESALALSSTLQAQHTSAQSSIGMLERKVEALEGLVRQRQEEEEERRVRKEEERDRAMEERVKKVEFESESDAPAPNASLTTLLTEWKKSVEGQWSSVQEEWAQERQRLSKAREEWEGKARRMDDGLERMERVLPFLANGVAGATLGGGLGNGHGHGHGLVTPPSPTSLSSNSTRSSPRRKQKQRSASSHSHSSGSSSDSSSGRGSSRGRGRRRRSASPNSSRGADTDDTEATLASSEDGLGLGHGRGHGNGNGLLDKMGEKVVELMKGGGGAGAAGTDPTGAATTTTMATAMVDDTDAKNKSREPAGLNSYSKKKDGIQFSSSLSSSSYGLKREEGDDDDPFSAAAGGGGGELVKSSSSGDAIGPQINGGISMQTAFGVLVLSVAAAAVVWRVKPDSV